MSAPVIIDAETGEVLSNIGWDSVGLHIPENTPFDEWQRLGGTLQKMERAAWLKVGRERFGGSYSLAYLRKRMTSYGNRRLARAEPMGVVYWADDNVGTPVYIGATAYCVRNRISEHRQKKTRFWLWLERNPDAVLHYIAVGPRPAVMRLERQLITTMRPYLNVA